ncbi:unnamed protein product (macronuclear) [Paramecium tetraurelia]|uniref:Uncharacterized protein n=1 Tax=Paramecium tetraurelia TaxID=5888 RepID=A0CVJ2_PARTE|nr:uncharacterized protein GSPATT00010977001 [Paramecium tetraurelia]CAK74809.1 unnamed protein product [Paramecium tetraurelia]|eukprot:XP_001442206.1 hypothetical protein (macronuclear) [Paramecium tetraurelia strain d4-2]
MHSNQFDEDGDPQEQFLEAFKELLEIQNQRMQNGNDLINQYCPQLLYPLIIPTQIPNTFIINMGPYYPHIQQPQLHPQMTQQQRTPQQPQQNLFQNRQNIKEEEQDDIKQSKGNWLQQKKQ